MTDAVLRRRDLNRALLARQGLLHREHWTVPEALEHLVGLQAQAPQPPYVGLWTRLAGFDPAELSTLIAERRAVRIPLMRSTIHLVTAEDALALRPALDLVLLAQLPGTRHGQAVAAVPPDELRATARELLAEADGLTTAELGEGLAERWPDVEAEHLAFAVRNLLPLVQTPPRGLWRRAGPPRLAHVEDWLGRPLRPLTVDAVLLRYLAAFGPASVVDAAWWSRLRTSALRVVVDRLRPRLRTFRSEDGVELFDLPDAPRPGGGVRAPVRFLPQFDNLLLSHADRTRVMTEEVRARVIVGGIIHGSVLVNGFVDGLWKAEAKGRQQLVRVEPFGTWPRSTVSAVERERARLEDFLAHPPDPDG